MGIKISQLPAAAASAVGDLFAVVQSGVTRQVAGSQLADWMVKTATSFVQSGASSTARTPQAKMREVMSVLDKGADSTGVADSRAAFLLADGEVSEVSVPAGTYRIASNTTLTASYHFQAGALLKLDAGVTVTMNGHLMAPIARVFNLDAAGSAIAGLGKNKELYIEWYGAAGDGVTSDDTPLLQALTTRNGTGGDIRLLPRNYSFSGSVVVVAPANAMRIVGAGRGISASGATIITHIGNNIGWEFNSANLWARVALEGFEIVGNAGASGKFASFSDASGHGVKNIGCTGYSSGSIFVLHNKIAWTEQFVAEDCMLRDAVAAFEFKRTSGTGGTDSFFGLVMRNVQCVPGGNGALVSAISTVGNELAIYGAEIDCRLWFDVGGAQGFFIGDYARFVQSHANVMVDGLSVPDGVDNLIFRAYSSVSGAAFSGFIDVEATVQTQQGANYADADTLVAMVSGPGIHIHRNYAHHNWVGVAANPAFGPNCHVKGAAVTIGHVATAADSTYLLEQFQPMTSYKLHLRVTGTGYIQDATYILSNYDVNTVSGVTLIAGNDSANAKCQTWTAQVDHSFSAGNGLQFELLILAATATVNLTWQLDIEML